MRETEAKFAVDPGVNLSDLAADLSLPAGLQLVDRQRIDTFDLYLDTGDLRLARHGYALRLRRKGSKRLITLKSFEDSRADEIQDRLELEELLTEADQLNPDAWPATIRQIVTEIAGREADWRPQCAISQDREKYMVAIVSEGEAVDSRGINLAELSLDRVDVLAPKTISLERDHGPVVDRFLEVEVELLFPEDEDRFVDLVNWLRLYAPLTPIGGNKLARGLRALASHPLYGSIALPGIQAEMRVSDACRFIWRQQLTEIVLNEAGVRADGDLEFVHDMRVATRRARAVDVLFGDLFRGKQVRQNYGMFKVTAKRLGAVRDMDVALAKLAEFGETLPEDQRAQLSPLRQLWQEQRHTPFQRLLQWLDSDAYATGLITLERFCSEDQYNGVEEGPQAVQIRHVLASRILARFEAVRRYEVAFEGTNRPKLTTLHALRIDCKYLRYILEFSQHLLGAEGNTLIRTLKALQDLLGDINDADVARTMLRRLPDLQQTQTVNTYLIHQKATIEELRGAVPAAIAACIDEDYRRMLGTAIARL